MMHSIVVNKGVFVLQTQSTAYAFGVDDRGFLRHLYFGARMARTDEFELPVLQEVSTNDPVAEITREEFPVYGGLRYKEYCLKARFADGVREVVYVYDGYTVTEGADSDELTVTLKDAHYPFVIELHYKVYPEYDLIERGVTVKNLSDAPIEIERLHSGQLHIPHTDLNFTNVHGHWAAEQQRFVQKVSYGKILVENRRGISTHNHNPYILLDRDATETSGEVWFAALKLSGNFSGIVEQTPFGETLAQLGINPHDFLLTLAPGESFTAPGMLCGYSDAGFERVSHNLHRYAGDRVLRPGLRPVLYNSWEATEFAVNAAEQMKLAERASEIGAELFVLDDGWFGERDGIDNGLGDWYVNPKKFPNGIDELIDKVKSLGLLFGIWVEPEMVNPKAKLYRDHPDWIYHFETRQTDTSRGQYVLDLTKPEVQTFVYEMLDDLLSSHAIDYIKWDANRPISQTSVKRDVWYRHIEAIYRIVTDLKKKHPNVLFEACASGGGRIDYGILGIFDDFWTSDNTDAYDRLYIEDSYSYIYPIKAMRAWVTDCPSYVSPRQVPMKFRFHSAMMGTLGIGCNILKFTDEDVALAQKMIAQYKEIRPIVQEGTFYRLCGAGSGDYFVYEYTKDDEGLLFAFVPQVSIGHRGVTVRLRGLAPDALYRLSTEEGEITKSGDYLMKRGLDLHLVGDYQSTLIRFQKI